MKIKKFNESININVWTDDRLRDVVSEHRFLIKNLEKYLKFKLNGLFDILDLSYNTQYFFIEYWNEDKLKYQKYTVKDYDEMIDFIRYPSNKLKNIILDYDYLTDVFTKYIPWKIDNWNSDICKILSFSFF